VHIKHRPTRRAPPNAFSIQELAATPSTAAGIVPIAAIRIMAPRGPIGGSRRTSVTIALMSEKK